MVCRHRAEKRFHAPRGEPLAWACLVLVVIHGLCTGNNLAVHGGTDTRDQRYATGENSLLAHTTTKFRICKHRPLSFNILLGIRSACPSLEYTILSLFLYIAACLPLFDDKVVSFSVNRLKQTKQRRDDRDPEVIFGRCWRSSRGQNTRSSVSIECVSSSLLSLCCRRQKLLLSRARTHFVAGWLTW